MKRAVGPGGLGECEPVGERGQLVDVEEVRGPLQQSAQLGRIRPARLQGALPVPFPYGALGQRSRRPGSRTSSRVTAARSEAMPPRARSRWKAARRVCVGRSGATRAISQSAGSGPAVARRPRETSRATAGEGSSSSDRSSRSSSASSRRSPATAAARTRPPGYPSRARSSGPSSRRAHSAKPLVAVGMAQRHHVVADARGLVPVATDIAYCVVEGDPRVGHALGERHRHVAGMPAVHQPLRARLPRP